MIFHSFHTADSHRVLRWLLPLSAVLLALGLVIFRIPYAHIEWGWLSYVWAATALGALLFLFLRRDGLKDITFNIILVGVLLWSAVTIVVMAPPSYFRSWQRLIYMALLLSVASPLINSPSVARFRRIVWIVLWWILGAYAIISLVIHIIFLAMHSGSWDYVYRGIFVSRMVCGLISAITAVAYSVPLFAGRVSRTARYFAGAVFVISIYLVVISTSRIAILAVVAGLMVVLTRIKVNYRLLLIVGGVCGALSVVMFCIFGDAIVAKLVHKAGFYAEENFLWSRSELFDARLREFFGNPIFGVGYASQRIITVFDHFSDWVSTGTIEPGSSWLSLLAQTGIIGFLLMGAFVWTVMVKAYALMHNAVPTEGSFNFAPKETIFHDRLNATSTLMCSPTTIVAVFVALLVESLVEGWILAGGSFFAMIFWLSCSMIQNTRLSPPPVD